MSAYAALAEPSADLGIVIVPDVRGLHPYYEELALRFAEAGIHAIAIDLYARTAGDVPRGPEFVHEPHVTRLDPAQVNDDVAAASAWLGGHASSIFSIGFCLGGRISLVQASTGLGLTGVIGLYPWPVGPHRSGIPAPADLAPEFACPVLAIYGGADTAIPQEQRAAFDEALDRAGVTHRTRDVRGCAALVLRPPRGGARRCQRGRLGRDPPVRGSRQLGADRRALL